MFHLILYIMHHVFAYVRYYLDSIRAAFFKLWYAYPWGYVEETKKKKYKNIKRNKYELLPGTLQPVGHAFHKYPAYVIFYLIGLYEIVILLWGTSSLQKNFKGYAMEKSLKSTVLDEMSTG